jgi:hypothetical protein
MLDEPYVECQGMAELLIAKCKLQNKFNNQHSAICISGELSLSDEPSEI